MDWGYAGGACHVRLTHLLTRRVESRRRGWGFLGGLLVGGVAAARPFYLKLVLQASWAWTGSKSREDGEVKVKHEGAHTHRHMITHTLLLLLNAQATFMHYIFGIDNAKKP